MITAILVDDEEFSRKALRRAVHGVGDVNILAECSSADDARDCIMRLNPDIVFLDVEMPGKNGFDLLSEIPHINFSIVFTTAFEHYAIQAIRSSALDFLLKPIDSAELQGALTRFRSQQSKGRILEQVNLLLENYHQSLTTAAFNKIAVPTNKGIEFIAPDSILRLEAENSYTVFFFTDGKKLTVAKTLKEVEELLPAKNFFRVHHSHLVNTNYIRRFQKADGGLLMMENGSEIPISRQKRDGLMNLLKRK